MGLVVVFMLLHQRKGSPIHTPTAPADHVAAVLTLIPPLVAALAYEFVSLLAAQALYRKVIAELVR